MKPLIGLSMDINVKDHFEVRIGRRYIDAVKKAGGIPIPLAQLSDCDLDQLLPTLGGLVLIGGLDYDPALYGEEPSDTVKLLHPDRQEFDLRLAGAAVRRAIPTLAICGGCQALNIVLGGSLIQDLETHQPGIGFTHKPQKDPAEEYPLHEIHLVQGSRLHGIFGQLTLAPVLSSHHQAVKRLGRGLVVAGHAPDGTVEAIELPGHPFAVGVQWHPEANLEDSAPLFRALVKAA